VVLPFPWRAIKWICEPAITPPLR